MKLKLKDTLTFYQVEEQLFHLHDSQTGKHFKIGAKEAGWLQKLDGKNTREDLKQFIPEEHFEAFLVSVEKLGLVQSAVAKRKFDPLKIKLKLININRWLGRSPGFNTGFRTFLNITSVLFLAANITMIYYSWDSLLTTTYASFLNWNTLWYYIVSILLIGFFHEMAHSVVAKSYGVNVPGMGIMLFYLNPAFYCDLSGINLLKDRRAKINILLSGILMNNILLTLSLAGFLSLHGSAVLVAKYLLFFALMNLVLILINLVPFVEYDGYYILGSLFNESRLKENAFLHLKLVLKNRFRQRVRMDYVIYAVYSLLFSLSLMFTMIIVLSRALNRIYEVRFMNEIDLVLIGLAFVYVMVRNFRGEKANGK